MSLLMDALKKAEQSKRGADIVDMPERAASEQRVQEPQPASPAAEIVAEEITLEIEMPVEPEQPQAEKPEPLATQTVERVAEEEELTLELDSAATDSEPEHSQQQMAEPVVQTGSEMLHEAQIAPQPRLEPRTYRPVVKARTSRLYLVLSLLPIVVAALVGSYFFLEAQLNSSRNDLLVAPSTMLPAMEAENMATAPVERITTAELPATKSAQVVAADKVVKPTPVPVKAEPVAVQRRPNVVPPQERNSTAKIKSLPARQPPTAVAKKEPVRVSHSQQKSGLQQQLEQAYSAYQSKDLRAAKQGYQQALKRAPDNRDALLGLAAVHQQQGDQQQARRYYQLLLKINPKDSVAVTGLLSLQGQGAVEKESQIKLLLDQEPNAAHLHYALGSQYVSQSRWSEAQQAFFQAFSNAPENPDYIFNLAVSLDHLGKRKMALVYYRRALEQSPGRQVGFDLGRLKQRISQLSTAGELL